MTDEKTYDEAEDVEPVEVPLFPEDQPVSDSDGSEAENVEVPDHVDDPDELGLDEDPEDGDTNTEKSKDEEVEEAETDGDE